MVKAKVIAQRETYSVRLDPELVNRLKHQAVDEKKTISELVEEGIRLLLERRAKTTKK